MKKFLSTLLVLTLLFSTAVPALAAGANGPTPPDWCPEEEYAVFEGSIAYTGEAWDTILALREYAAAGNSAPPGTSNTALYRRYLDLKMSADPGVWFELGLISVKYALNAAVQGKHVSISSHFDLAAYYHKESGAEDCQSRYLSYLWNARANLWNRDITTGLEGGLRWFAGAMEYVLHYEQFTMAQLLDWGKSVGIPQARLDYAKNLLFVTLDGDLVHPRSVRISSDYVDYTTAHIRNGRTMVPVRRLAELMGATVDYNAATKEITITRAADTIVLTLNSTTAYRNGVPFQMDVAPYIENNRTFIPIRYIAEFFAQKVEWVGKQRHVVITEDKSVAGSSNLEDWALAMGAMLSYINTAEEAHLFGGKARFGTDSVGSDVSNLLLTTGPDFGRYMLGGSWGIYCREDLIETVQRMTIHGHNDSFQEDANIANSLTSAEMEKLISVSSAVDAYMWPYTKELSEKWGDRGILCWDLFRMSNLVQWGYLAGYVTYSEALALLEPAAALLKENFSSWDEAYENYLDGYHWWARENVLGQDVWASDRGLLYLEMKDDPLMGPLFDDSLFRTGVIGLPEQHSPFPEKD